MIFAALAVMAPLVPALPSLAIPAPKTQQVYAVVSAYATNGIESDYSAQISWVSTNNAAVTVAWDRNPAGPIPTSGYALYWGTNSGVYQWRADAGNATNYTFTPIPVVPVTNYIALWMQSTPGIPMAWSNLTAKPSVILTQSAAGILGPSNLFFRIAATVSTNAP